MKNVDHPVPTIEQNYKLSDMHGMAIAPTSIKLMSTKVEQEMNAIFTF